MSENKEIWMETTHGRKSKCKTEFKAVVNKVLISTLVITTLLGATATPASAAMLGGIYIPGVGGANPNTGYKETITQEYGVTVESSIQEINNTIAAINQMKREGTVSSATLKNLATQLYSLESAARTSGEGASDRIVAIINKAESAISGLLNAGDAEVAIVVVRAGLGIQADTTTTINKQTSATQSALKGFKDVAKDRWSHDAIMEMVKIGMFAGTTSPDANGMGTFEPTATMTRAQFITVVTRYLYKDQLDGMKMEEGAQWYTNNYIIAINNDIIEENEFSYDSLNKPITRQEMAMVMVRACEKKGETADDLVPTTRIADYDTIGTYYRDYVRQAFSMGLIAGYDAQGTFGPKDTLTREQGAMVVYRLVNKDSRAEVDNSAHSSSETPVAGAIIIYEGQHRTNRPAQVGDTVIKADGTKVVLKLGPNGILGEGQGVAPDLGLDLGYGQVRNGGTFIYNHEKYPSWADSTNTAIHNNRYSVNNTTGEGHWANEWAKIEKAYASTKPTHQGTKGEISKDAMHLWRWSSAAGEWWQNRG